MLLIAFNITFDKLWKSEEDEEDNNEEKIKDENYSDPDKLVI